MAFKLMEKNWDHQKGAYVQEWLVDSEAELSQVMSSPGDIALVAEGGKRFIMDTSGEWEKCPEGSGGGVASWNDLEDKPFGDNADGTIKQMSGKYIEGMGYGETSWVWLVPEMTTQVSTKEVLLPYNGSPHAEATVKVVWDGEEYNVKTLDKNGFMILGNASLMGAGPNTGEPFLFGFDEQAHEVLLVSNVNGTVTFSVGYNTEIYQPIRTELLPIATDYARGAMSGEDVLNFVRCPDINLNVGELKYGEVSSSPFKYAIAPMFYANDDWYTGLHWGVFGTNGIGYLTANAIDPSGVLCLLLCEFTGISDDSVLSSVRVEYPQAPTT